MNEPEAGPWRRHTIEQIVRDAARLGERDELLRRLLEDCDDSQLQLTRLSLLAAQRAAEARLAAAARDRVRPIYDPRD